MVPESDAVTDIHVHEELDELFRRAREYDRLISRKNVNGRDWNQLGQTLRQANGILALGLVRSSRV